MFKWIFNGFHHWFLSTSNTFCVRCSTNNSMLFEICLQQNPYTTMKWIKKGTKERLTKRRHFTSVFRWCTVHYAYAICYFGMRYQWQIFTHVTQSSRSNCINQYNECAFVCDIFLALFWFFFWCAAVFYINLLFIVIVPRPLKMSTCQILILILSFFHPFVQLVLAVNHSLKFIWNPFGTSVWLLNSTIIKCCQHHVVVFQWISSNKFPIKPEHLNPIWKWTLKLMANPARKNRQTESCENSYVN